MAKLVPLLIGLALLGSVASAPAWSQNGALTMLSQLEHGNWQIHDRDSGATSRLCVRNGAQLLQLRHLAADCKRIVIEDSADMVTVQYACQGHGFGRTSIRRETNRLVQIESQGIVDGRPFQFTAEARRTAPCH